MANQRLIYKDEFGDTHTTDEKIDGKLIGEKAVREKLFEYEQEESEGKLIHMPCKIDDKVYLILGVQNRILEFTVKEIRLTSRFLQLVFAEGSTYSIWDYRFDLHFGKTVFLTREEAERALNSSEKTND